MNRLPRRIAVPVLAVGLLLPAAPPASAALDAVVVKTVRIGDRPVRFVLAVEGSKAFVLMKFKRKGKWRTVASDKSECVWNDSSYAPALQVQKADRQVLIGWTYQGGDQAAEYGGYNVKRQTIDMFGSDVC
jgi:hypothetical protein